MARINGSGVEVVFVGKLTDTLFGSGSGSEESRPPGLVHAIR